MFFNALSRRFQYDNNSEQQNVIRSGHWYRKIDDLIFGKNIFKMAYVFLYIKRKTYIWGLTIVFNFQQKCLQSCLSGKVTKLSAFATIQQEFDRANGDVDSKRIFLDQSFRDCVTSDSKLNMERCSDLVQLSIKGMKLHVFIHLFDQGCILLSLLEYMTLNT